MSKKPKSNQIVTKPDAQPKPTRDERVRIAFKASSVALLQNGLDANIAKIRAHITACESALLAGDFLALRALSRRPRLEFESAMRAYLDALSTRVPLLWSAHAATIDADIAREEQIRKDREAELGARKAQEQKDRELYLRMRAAEKRLREEEEAAQ